MRKFALAGLTVVLLGGLSAAATSYTIYQLQTPPGHTGEQVQTTGVVTGIVSNGLYIEDAGGGQYSGVWVYTMNSPVNQAPTLSLGDTAQVQGTMLEYYGLTELDASSGTVAVTLEGTAGDVPAPAVVTCNQITNGGTESEEYEGVLVKVLAVTVNDDQCGYNNYRYMVTDGGTAPNELMIDAYPFPSPYQDFFDNAYVGDYMDSITGIVHYERDEFIVRPRSDNDLEGEETPAEPDIIPIYSIQMGLVTGGERVKVWGMCTTGTGDCDEGFYIQDPSNYGGSEAYNGIYVYDINNVAGVAKGDSVIIIGEYSEYYDFSEIAFERFSIDTPPVGAMPTPVALTTADFSNAVTMDPYEGVLVSVDDAVVTDEDGSFGNWVIDDGSGEAEVSNASNNPYKPVNGDYVDLIGPVHYSYSVYRICPGPADYIDAEYRVGMGAAGWKMMSVPLRNPTPIADCLFDDGVERKLFADAASSSWVQDPVYYYTNTYKSLRPAGGDDDMIRGEYGYWMLLYQAGLTFIVPVY